MSQPFFNVSLSKLIKIHNMFLIMRLSLGSAPATLTAAEAISLFPLFRSYEYKLYGYKCSSIEIHFFVLDTSETLFIQSLGFGALFNIIT